MPCTVVSGTRLPVPAAKVRRLTNAALRSLEYKPQTTDVTVVIVDDRRMRALNERYRGRRQTTNVLSFRGTGRELGDIIVSLPEIRRQARQFGTSLVHELQLVIIHGLLHLAGYDHVSVAGRRRMGRAEERLLAGNSLITRTTPT